MSVATLPALVADTELSLTEKSDFEECEAVIERGLESYVEVGLALARIRDNRFYRATHKDWQSYCRARWDLSKTYANDYIKAAGVAKNLTAIAVKPKNLALTRSIAALEPQQQCEAWSVAQEQVGDKEVTAWDLKKAAE
jgi:hypothetical protein